MKYIFIILVFFAAVSCGNLDEMNLNPDTPTTVTPNFLATKIILSSTDSPASKWLFGDSWLMKSTSFTEHMEWYLYNKFDRGSFSTYSDLTDGQKMVELAESNKTLPQEEKNAYQALNYFMRAYVFYNLTMQMGDIPCSDALKGETEGIFSPKYDTQEEIFKTIINDLQHSSDLFSKASVLKGDPLFKGNVNLWQRTANSFLLRVLNMLSSKQSVSGINIKTLFEQVAQLPLIEGESSSYQRVYDATKNAQWYPFYYLKQNFWSYPVFTSYFVDMLKDLNDYRLFYYAEPATALSGNPSSFNVYSGVNPVLEFGKIQAEYSTGIHSSINKRYFRVPQGEPIKFIAYSEIQFILAEAALRGWTTPLSAKEHYEKGVRAAMKFTADNTPIEHRHDITIDDAYIDSYLKGKALFNAQIGLQQIMTQKYIGSFVQLPFNSYYDYRRTGLPELPIDPATNMNELKDRLPVRWMYPANEYSQNKNNIEEATQRQFNGTDTPNDVMWLLK
ncbi:MAG TPA: SusD/RagB family nutrient-binding outer membrane lipoprotein [Petrimonas sp.]|uniref:SusD/RagB family nutrient-binding outer membrane lipoprotein n=1 Tax=Petrimonas sp. TaxID=2023866 RepID=UPI001765098C|nr:SusD/RagB family nutrient-binding outer membrane lipoprotein [Petrimonas sp.]MEA5045059.1 SusD/RagB family nutrient-binding outer membrane lipoprotein [Petrimonas sp.]MEA5063137.1 SusD/RagB family nutrient-binding outer membrane lipoprotein [Petrimonas sp.]HHV86158.1 SusD/RagB family nutrient-binding outer membrane lipoprotein [Petrimonas sp.]